MINLLSIVLLALSVTVSSEAFADDASGLGDDEISLKNGGMVRGTIIVVEPGEEATIVVKGKEKTFSWEQIDKVERGKYKEDTADAPKKKPKKESDEAEDDEETLDEPVKGAPFVHIQATYPGVQLVRLSSGSVCPAPCDQIVDARDGSEFYFIAPNMTPSSPIKLAPYDGKIEARVRGRSRWTRLGGSRLVVAGMTAGIAGIVVLPIGLATDYNEMTIGGGIALGFGAALIISGVVVIIATRTTVEIVPRTAKSTGVRFENGALRF